MFGNKKMSKDARSLSYRWARFIYNTEPTLLKDIGWDRKYKTVKACYYGEKLEEKQQILKPIKTYRNPTDFQISELADSLFQRLGEGKCRRLASELTHRAGSSEDEDDGY